MPPVRLPVTLSTRPQYPWQCPAARAPAVAIHDHLPRGFNLFLHIAGDARSGLAYPAFGSGLVMSKRTEPPQPQVGMEACRQRPGLPECRCRAARYSLKDAGDMSRAAMAALMSLRSRAALRAFTSMPSRMS